MKVAYVVSGMKLTFVVAEMEAHERAGWQVLPLASCKCGSLEGLSEVVTKWSGALFTGQTLLRRFGRAYVNSSRIRCDS